MTSSLVRPPRDEDAETIASLYAASYGDFRPTDAEEIRSWLANEELKPEWLRVLAGEDGRVVGYGDLWIDGDEVALDVAAPGHWHPFVDWAEDAARASGAGRVRVWFPEGHELEGVLAGRGYAPWRSSFTMEIDLTERPVAVPPDGLELRTYRDEDAEPLRASLNEAFTDDPFWHEVSASSFHEFYVRARGFDPQLWLLAWDRAEIAGSSLAYPQRGSDDRLGWIGTLSVRRPWRGRGLGKALLRASFARLYDRGLRRVGLGVDAENPTGAVRLYESVGMRRVRRGDNWVKHV
jgi:ribosomal protein S18 acetylase RimI-like enzyme